MKKRLLTILFSLSLIAVFINFRGQELVSPTAYAVGDLTVDWGVSEGLPIFTISNMAPGNIENRTVAVHNAASTNRPVGIRAIKTSETGDLASVIDIVISNSGTDLYGGSSPTGPKTMADLFSESSGPDGIALSTLTPGQTVNYNIRVTFQSTSGNQFQAKQLVFTLKIGIAISIPAECQNIPLSGDPIFGTSGNDTLRGTNGNDFIFGLEGNDRINTSNGQDCIVGGDGNDTLSASNAKDVILGGSGNDRINGSNGVDYIDGGEGNDTIDGSNGNDTIFGGDGQDNISGSNGDDFIDGGADNDTIKGGNGKDNLTGGAGNDSANGGLGIDTCSAETESSCEL